MNCLNAKILVPKMHPSVELHFFIMQRNFLTLAVFAGLTISVAGCGPAGLKLYPVTGTVKFADGTVPQGEFARVTFQPTGGAVDVKAASGDIQPDGSFQLMTIVPGDGALAGDYKVIVTVTKGYPDMVSLIGSEYGNAQDTPLNATVKAGEPNHFDFVVIKAAGAP
jgi:hypothetical protein